jgi:hypothetical protein
MPSQTERASGCWSALGSLDVGPCGRGWRLFSPAAWAGAVHHHLLGWLNAKERTQYAQRFSYVVAQGNRGMRIPRLPAHRDTHHLSPRRPSFIQRAQKQEPTPLRHVLQTFPRYPPDGQGLTGRWTGLRSGRRWWRRGWAPQLSWATYTSRTGSHTLRLSAPSADPPAPAPMSRWSQRRLLMPWRVNGAGWVRVLSEVAFSLATLASRGFSLLDGETAHVVAVKLGALGLLPREHRPDPAILQVRFRLPLGATRRARALMDRADHDHERAPILPR